MSLKSHLYYLNIFLISSFLSLLCFLLLVSFNLPPLRLHFQPLYLNTLLLFMLHSHFISSASLCAACVSACLTSGSRPPCWEPFTSSVKACLSASLLNSCHENQTDTLNWCSRLKETGLKYLHNFLRMEEIVKTCESRPWLL